MRYPSTRLAVVSSLMFLVLWLGSSLLEALASLAGRTDVTAFLSRRAWTYDLPLLGFIGLMILGMAQHFVPMFSGRALWDGRVAMAQVLVADAGVALTLTLPPEAEFVGLGLWALAALLFVVLILLTLRSEEIGVRPMERRPGLGRVDRLAIPMTGAAILYLLAASVGFLLAALPGDPARVTVHWFSFLHLYTLGFISLMVFGVGLHLLPRFLDAVPNRAAVRVLLVLALPSPAGVALLMPLLHSFADPLRPLFVLVASMEALAALLFSALVGVLWWTSGKRRPATSFHVLAGLWLSLGVALGVAFGVDPVATLGWAPAHGWVNLLGFAGFSILGVLAEVLPPYAARGPAAIRRATRAHQVLGTLGLLLVLAGIDAAVRGTPGVAGILSVLGFAGLLAVAGSVAAGTLGTLLGIRTGRPAL